MKIHPKLKRITDFVEFRGKKKNPRRSQHFFAWFVPVRLGDYPRLLGELRGEGMVEIIRVFFGVGEHKLGMMLPENINQLK